MRAGKAIFPISHPIFKPYLFFKAQHNMFGLDNLGHDYLLQKQIKLFSKKWPWLHDTKGVSNKKNYLETQT